ncbi:hypothetical protein SmJEL517_g03317 [Synchytrium microbalum]|uniref:DNA mismatch repair protein MSH3 n=1 Tax=Synchytrium microbalum TaxID=1806994 RepID=A0A507C756_9FUNG|nr:uncharacterized protein SmJEL517_g03317 [Synchytrium microbalum]TPX33894.1 hypothetical protein SmJEL517_g03317 [Synchytrium microbalum]
MQRETPSVQSSSGRGRSSVVSASDKESSSGRRTASSKSNNEGASRPKTSASRPKTATSRENSVIVCISQGRGVASDIGMASMDIKTSECILHQFGDTPSYVKLLHKLHLYNPLEVLMSSTMNEPPKSKICEAIEGEFPDISIAPVDRKYFKDSAGLNYIKEYGLEADIPNLIVGIQKKYFALTALASLLKHIELHRSIGFPQHSIQFKFQAIDGTVMIDAVTSRNLELVTNITAGHHGFSLFSVLNHTCTPMGARLLRTNILQPPSNERTINTRLDSVEDLIHNQEMFFAVKSALKGFPDVHHLITSLIQVNKKPSVKHSEQSTNHVITLKHTLECVGPLQAALTSSRSELIRSIYKTIAGDDLELMRTRIDEVINEDVALQRTPIGLRNQRCYAAGYNGLLDVARQTYKETTNDIYEATTQYSQKYELDLKLSFSSSVNGFLLSTTKELLGDRELPLEFINVSHKKNVLSFTTLRIMAMNDRINESLTEVYLMSDRTIAELVTFIRAHIAYLYRLSECVALLDMIMSFAHYSTITNCTRPEFTQTLAIRSGRHPIRDAQNIGSFVPNDVYAVAGGTFEIVTGPNMAGKSTYLRQIALINIVGQLGCFVPAEYASFRIIHSLFSRIGNDDCSEANASSFMIEMREAAYILQNATPRSLIIIDELGRGTSTYDGLGMTFAIAEDLIDTKAFVFFATHFSELAHDLDLQPNVVNLHLKVTTSSACAHYTSQMSTTSLQPGGLHFTYCIGDGPMEEGAHYGLQLASVSGFPNNIIERAEVVAIKLEKMSAEARMRNQVEHQENALKMLNTQFAQRLCQARRSSNLSEPELRKYLHDLQTEYLQSRRVLEGGSSAPSSN